MLEDQMKYVLIFIVVWCGAQGIVSVGIDDQITISEMTAVSSIIYQMPRNCSIFNKSPSHYIIQRITPSESIFQIDKDGRIKLMSMLDAERQPNYEMIISNQAVNWTLNIDVSDENDNAPVFQSPIYETTLLENTPSIGTTGHFLTRVIANDFDISAPNRLIMYGLIVNSTTGFYVLSNGEIYSRRTFDYETQKQFTFIATATNVKSTVRLTGYALVRVNILDVNDNRPVFTPSMYSFRTVANEGVIVGVVQATDADTGKNGVLHYSIQPDLERGTRNVPFKVLSRGEIVTTSTLQNGAQYHFLVTATDSSGFPTSSSATVFVQVAGQLRNATDVILLNVSESLPRGHIIYGSGGFDNGSEFQFKISPPEMGDQFVVRQGGLYLREKLDYETQKIFQFKVSVSIYSQEFLVMVTDSNDEKPVVSISPSYVRMTTNYPVGSVVAVVHANDPDPNNVLKYRIVSGDPTNIFNINDQGVIQTIRCLSNAAVQFTMLMVNVSDGIHTVSKSIPLQIHRSTDKDFENNCAVDCNPVSISLTSTADGNVSFSNVVKDGRQLNTSEIEQIVSNPNGIDYAEIQSGITDALIGFFKKRYTLTSLNVTMLSLLSSLRQRRATQRSGYLNAEYVFTIKTTDASLSDLNPIKRNETIQFNDTSAFALQTDENLSTVSDVDECASGEDLCDLNAYCMAFPNTIAYACQCKDGYTGDGYSCQQKVEKESDEMDKKVVIGVAVGAGVLVIVMVIAVVVLCKNKIRYQNDLKRLNAIQSVQLVDKKNGNTNPAYK